MKIIETLGAQGEVRMFRIDKLPISAKPIPDHVIGHSETGHHHVLVAEKAQVFEDTKAPKGMRILYALLESPGKLEHQRGFDTHEPHIFKTGDLIMFRMDREYDPYAELARQVQD